AVDVIAAPPAQPGGEAPVPLQGVPPAPGVLLSARSLVEVERLAADLDAAADRERRLRPDVRRRSEPLPLGLEEEEGLGVRGPVEVPTSAGQLSPAAPVVEHGAADRDLERIAVADLLEGQDRLEGLVPLGCALVERERP